MIIIKTSKQKILLIIAQLLH